MKPESNFMKPERVAVVAAALSGAVTHLYGLVNVLHNYDDIAQQPKGYGTGVTSGRWLLSLLGDFAERMGGGYNLPTVNGFLFLLLIACSAGFLVSVLGIQNRKSAALMGGLFAVFPTAFSTLVFRYTAVYYGIGILLSVLAAWVLHRYKFGVPLSALCVAFSLGIYQAYVPITIGIAVLLLIRQALEEDVRLRELVRRGLRDCAAFLLGFLLYLVFLKITLELYGTELSNYQGVDQMGNLSLMEIPKLAWKAAYSVYMLPFKNYCGISAAGVIKLAYLVIGCVSLLPLGFLLFRKARLGTFLFVAMLCAVFPVAVNFIVIMCPNGWIYTLMVYAFVLIPCVPILLLECLPQKGKFRTILERGVCFVTAVLICGYAYQTNIQYMTLYYANRQTENYLNSMVVQVRMTEDFTTELKWAMIGEIEDPLLGCYWEYELAYGGIEYTDSLLRRYSWKDWIHNYYGYEIPLASEGQIAELRASDEVKHMPCWPNQGSIKVIGDTIVIKCQD